MSLGISPSSLEESARLSAQHYRRGCRITSGEEDNRNDGVDANDDVIVEEQMRPLPQPPSPLGDANEADGCQASPPTAEPTAVVEELTGAPHRAMTFLRVDIPLQSLNATRSEILYDPPPEATSSSYGCATRRHADEIGRLSGRLVALVRSLRPLLTDGDFLPDSDSRRSSAFTANRSRFSSRSRLSVVSTLEGPLRSSEYVDPLLTSSFSPDDDPLTKPPSDGDSVPDSLPPPATVGQLPRTFSLAINGGSVYDDFLSTLDAIQRAARSAAYHASEEIGDARRFAEELQRKLEALSKKHDATVKNLMMANSRANVAYRLMVLSRSTPASPPREESASFQRLAPTNAMNDEGEDDTLEEDELYTSTRPGIPYTDADATAVASSSPVELANQLLRARRQVQQYVKLITDLPVALQAHHDYLQTRFSTVWQPAAQQSFHSCWEEMERCFDCARLMHRGEL